LENFLEPEREVLRVSSGDDVVEVLAKLTPEQARQIGERARHRLLQQHTYQHRARELYRLLTDRMPVVPKRTNEEIHRASIG
jgi:spore maturation protein CgeB